MGSIPPNSATLAFRAERAESWTCLGHGSPAARAWRPFPDPFRSNQERAVAVQHAVRSHAPAVPPPRSPGEVAELKLLAARNGIPLQRQQSPLKVLSRHCTHGETFRLHKPPQGGIELSAVAV